MKNLYIFLTKSHGFRRTIAGHPEGLKNRMDLRILEIVFGYKYFGFVF